MYSTVRVLYVYVRVTTVKRVVCRTKVYTVHVVSYESTFVRKYDTFVALRSLWKYFE